MSVGWVGVGSSGVGVGVAVDDGGVGFRFGWIAAACCAGRCSLV